MKRYKLILLSVLLDERGRQFRGPHPFILWNGRDFCFYIHIEANMYVCSALPTFARGTFGKNTKISVADSTYRSDPEKFVGEIGRLLECRPVA